jgi:hypothetical protein
LEIQHDPKDVEQLQQNKAVYHLFQDAGWEVYFERLQGFDTKVKMDFTQNLTSEKYMVMGVDFFVTKEIISKVMGLPQEGE